MPAAHSVSTCEVVRTKHVTSSPWAARALVKWVPMKPLAPVTKTLLMARGLRDLTMAWGNLPVQPRAPQPRILSPNTAGTKPFAGQYQPA